MADDAPCFIVFRQYPSGMGPSVRQVSAVGCPIAASLIIAVRDGNVRTHEADLRWLPNRVTSLILRSLDDRSYKGQNVCAAFFSDAKRIQPVGVYRVVAVQDG